MAPSHSCVLRKEEERLPGKEKNKLRKPVVEKMRRDRINSSIEQLKLLLEREFPRHQPNSKLEKADILEVAVSYLKQQQQHHMQRHAFSPKSPEFDFNTGYLRCLREALHFLSLCEPKKEAQARLLKHFCKVQVTVEGAPPSSALMRCYAPPSPCPPSRPKPSSKSPPSVTATLWRPW
nr:transcription factor HES-5-like [Anolis sagrei ordinatus]